ncbi:hypothetical protein WSK_1345 [Novosphingobium sp. Rr 2-17]|uniref:hypothetical protein n=1 Tax=Novosphingobium sp. Rr 2-17 TaxID=555793 RepID=UPI00026984E3|nr:hypothetical protein [Novosphingobium sp. Rr 2-17]EIZ79979.1 hypothetical protein WSK_1345 [Novosphingobium sp. Rr 2-17]
MLGRSGAAMALAVACALPASAMAATNIECIDSGYSAKDTATLGKYFANFRYETFDNGAMEKLVPIFAARAGECASEYGWSVDAISDAVFYRTSELLGQALTQRPPYKPEDMKKLETALARADPARMRKIFGPIVQAQIENSKASEMSGTDETYLGMLLMSSGLPMEGKHVAEFAGALIGARIMKQIYAEKFAAR